MPGSEPARRAPRRALGWRGAFLTVVALGMVALVALLTLVPPVAGAAAGGLRAQARQALAPRVLLMLAIGLLLLGGAICRADLV